MTPWGDVKIRFEKDLELVRHIQKEANAFFNPWKG